MQGKRQDQVESAAMFAFISFIISAIAIIIALI